MTISKAFSVGNKVKEFVSVKDFGAIGDGTTDDAAALQAAAAINLMAHLEPQGIKNHCG